MAPSFQISAGRVAATVAAILFETLFPLAAAWFVGRRLRVSWRYFAYGAVIFLIFQVMHLQETFSDVVKTDKTGLSKTAHTRWMISAFANFLPGSTIIFRLA